jgi:hypothetical protein
VVELIRRLLVEVGRGAPLAAEARPGVAGVGAVTVTRRWESETPNSAGFELEPGLAPAPLEAELGAATPLPGTGAARILLLGDGEGPATVLVGLADDGDVQSVTVRRER